MADLGNSLVGRPHPAAADSILRCAWEIADHCDERELAEEIREEHARMRATFFTIEAAREIVPKFEPLFGKEEASRALRDWVAAPWLSEAVEILQRRRWLLSADLDDAVVEVLDELSPDVRHDGFRCRRDGQGGDALAFEEHRTGTRFRRCFGRGASARRREARHRKGRRSEAHPRRKGGTQFLRLETLQRRSRCPTCSPA